MRLKDKSIIITGASSGIGRAAALRFAKEGARLVLNGRRSAPLEAVADQIRAQGGAADAVAGDVSDAATAAALVEAACASYGRLDGAFNNAGMIGEMTPIAEMSAENWRAVLSANLDSAFFAAKAQIPALIETGGALLFTSSFVGHTIGLPGMGAYAAAKAGMIGLVQALAVEAGPHGVRVNALLPGGTRTAMAGDDAAYHETVAGFHALKRMAEPEEIANAALFLLSDEASFVTGAAILADGGNSISKI